MGGVTIGILLDFIKKFGLFTSSSPIKNRLSNPDDETFIEVAVAGRVKSLITRNKKTLPFFSN